VAQQGQTPVSQEVVGTDTLEIELGDEVFHHIEGVKAISLEEQENMRDGSRYQFLLEQLWPKMR